MISVIVPMYNRLSYIRPCIESILRQTYKDIEVLCVMDGYSNEIDAILQDIQTNDKRIRIECIDHQGAAAARNHGINKSRGELIAFCDSDDLLPINAYEIMVNEIVLNDVDVVIGDYLEIFDSGKKDRFNTPKDEVDDFNPFLESVTVWNRLFKKEFILKNNLSFDTRYYGDDRIFCADAFLANPRIKVINEIVYLWLRHENDIDASITHYVSEKKFYNDISMWNCFIDKFPLKWHEKLNEHMRYSFIYITSIFDNIEVGNKINDVFLEFKKLVLKVDWENNNELFFRIFKTTIEGFKAFSSYQEYIELRR